MASHKVALSSKKQGILGIVGEYEEKMNRIYIAKLKHLDKRYDIHRRARKMERERRGR